MDVVKSAEDERQLRNFKVIVRLAIGTTLIAAVAGILFWILDPATGSSSESVLGIVAAISGIATAVLAITAAIYAQVKNLWRFASTWARVVAWVFIAVGIGITLWNLIQQAS